MGRGNNRPFGGRVWAIAEAELLWVGHTNLRVACFKRRDGFREFPAQKRFA